jgi:hypothetical protein
MTLAALTLSVLLALPHPPAEAHARSLADAIANASHQSPLWVTGDAGEDETAVPAGEGATAAVLVGIAIHESGLSERIARCRYRKGEADNGRALGSWQLLGPVARGPYRRLELCASDALQAERAVAVLMLSRRAGLSGMLHAFASGDASKPSQAGRELAAGVAAACKRFWIVCGTTPRWVAPS